MKTTNDKINDHLNNGDDELENANYHSFVGITRELFEAVKDLVPEQDQVKLAKKIAETVINKI